jgi:hypothetical protein
MHKAVIRDTCSTHVRAEKCVQNFRRKTSGGKEFSLLYTILRTHRLSHFLLTGGCFPEVKRLEPEPNNLPPSSADT